MVLLLSMYSVNFFLSFLAQGCSNESRNLSSKKHNLFLGTASRRGSRPFLSPDERPDLSNEGSLGSVGGRSTRSGRRDSLSPDSANEESKFQIVVKTYEIMYPSKIFLKSMHYLK